MSIQVQNILKNYPQHTALKGISFEVKAGSIHGLLGPNGAGKSTAMRILLGLLQPSSGFVEIEGIRIEDWPRERRPELGFLPENPSLYQEMTVVEYLKFVARLFSLDPLTQKLSLEEVHTQMNLASISKRIIGNLSKGQKQKVALAATLITRPKIIVLDEPTSGLDPQAQREIRELIQDLSLEKGRTILLSTHLLHEVKELCSEITLIHQGTVRATGPMQKVMGVHAGKSFLDIQLQRWDSAKAKLLRDQFPIQILEEKGKSPRYEIRCLLNEDTSLAKISSWMHEQDLGLLSFTQQTPELEDFFLKMTEN